MSRLVHSSVLLLVFVVSAYAQLQKSPVNRIYVDEDLEHTEAARRARTVKEQTDKGKKLYRGGDYGGAAKAFRIAVDTDPTIPAVQYNLGAATLRLGDYRGAAKAFKSAVKLDQKSADAWHLLGFAFYNLKNNDEATRCYLRALEIDQKLGVTWSNLGQIYLEREKLQDAEAAFTRAQQLEPEASEPINGLCVTYARLRKSDLALQMCARALSENQTLNSAYYLAWSYLDLARYAEAIAMLQECLKIDPNKAMVYVALAEGHYHLKRYKEALSYAQKAVEMNPDFSAAYASMGFIYFQMKKLKEAKKVFEKALVIKPESPAARYNLAMTCLALQQRDCAREQYSILKTEEPVLSTQLFDQIYSDKIVRLKKH